MIWLLEKLFVSHSRGSASWRLAAHSVAIAILVLVGVTLLPARAVETAPSPGSKSDSSAKVQQLLDLLADPDIREYLGRKLDRTKRKRLLIKEFPTGGLTIAMLKAWLDSLERFEKFVPSMLIIDYADLMAIKDAKNKRDELGEIYKQLRGIGVERNIAIVTATQTNREGIGATNVDVGHLSEDISKSFTADTIITYNQTEQEYALGMARLFLAKHRDDEAKRWILIAQSYAIGQFCMDSAPMINKYWDFIKSGGRVAE